VLWVGATIRGAECPGGRCPGDCPDTFTSLLIGRSA